MNYSVRFNVYKTPEGTVTNQAKGNELVLMAGATISREEAERLGIPELDKQTNERASQVTDQLADLKPAEKAEATPDKPAKGRKAHTDETASTGTQEA
jgi:enoyl-CoA hydratase/carnithine racemase